MKKLSIYEKAQRYDEVIERAKSLLNSNQLGDAWIYKLLPELKESGGEKIKEKLIDTFNFYDPAMNSPYLLGINRKDILAWLEKQGEQKSIWHREDEQNLNACLGYIPDEFLRRWLIDAIHTRFDKPVDKPEPKFNIGDWVVDEKGVVKQILSYKNNVYKHTYGYSAKMFEDEWRLWDITKDARDGDVLVCEGREYLLFKSFSNTDGRIKLYCWYNRQTNNFHTSTDGKLRQEANIYPATKEQRDLLFQKMKEAGYTFDFERKELKKIVNEEQIKKNLQDNGFRRMFEKNNVWGKEDEYNLAWIIETLLGLDGDKEYTDSCKKMAKWLKYLKDRVQPQPKQEWSEDDIIHYNKCLQYLESISPRKEDIEWFKSIRPKKQWKPSKEQITWLYRAADEASKYSRMKQILNELLSDLKKLREE